MSLIIFQRQYAFSFDEGVREMVDPERIAKEGYRARAVVSMVRMSGRRHKPAGTMVSD